MSSSQTVLDPLARGKVAQILTTDVDGTERVLSMLRHMVSIGVATEESYQIALKALASRGRIRWRQDDSTIICAADEVSGIIHELEEREQGISSAETYEYALQAYAACSTPRGSRTYAQQAQALLEHMDDSPNVEVTPECISHVIHAWAWQQQNLNSDDCARMAQENFDRLLELSPPVPLLQRSQHYLLEAWSKSKGKDSNERAMRILQEMQRIKEMHPEESQEFPNANSFSNAILAWSKGDGFEAATKAQEILDQALVFFRSSSFHSSAQPELIAFNGVLSAWARLGRADKAEAILRDLEELEKRYPSLAPDLVTYNTVMVAHLKTRDKSVALDNVLHGFDRMEKAAKRNPDLHPNSFSYDVLLKAWAQSRHPNSAAKAVEALSLLRERWLAGDTTAKPSNRYYNIAINALAKSRDYLNARKAYELLLEMQTSNNCRPDIITFTSVIECFSKSKDPEAFDIAVDLLRQAAAIYEETQDSQVRPNVLTYSLTISAANTNPTLRNIERARELLSEILNLCDEFSDGSLGPLNAYPFNYVLNCASSCIGNDKDKLRAFQIAAQTYNDIRKRENAQPDSYTYAFWFKCCNNLLAPESELRAKGLTLAFEQCKVDGLVSAETLRRIMYGTPPHLAKSILNVDPDMSTYDYRALTIDDLPANWSRNIQSRYSRR